MRTVPVLASVFAALAIAGCGSSPSSPSAAQPASPPTTVTGTVRSLKVTGPPLVIGDTAQFSAMATMAEGTFQDVTALATWTSSNPSIATVDSTGKVKALADGGVSIRATFRGATDSEYHNVTPVIFFRTTGVVSEVPPGFNAVSGARVEIVTGHNQGMSQMTDASGNFDMGTLQGGNYTFRISRSGFNTDTRTVAITRDLKIDVLLYPVPPSGATARCKDKSWSNAADKASACSRNGGVAYWVCPGPFCANP